MNVDDPSAIFACACNHYHISLQGQGVRWRGIVNIVLEKKEPFL